MRDREIQPSDFPLLRAALLKAQTATAVARRSRTDAAWDKASRAWNRAHQAYADHLLEPILGCLWVLMSPVSQSTGIAYPRTADGCALVSLSPKLLPRGLAFVRRGSFPLAARTTAFVTEPSVFADDGSLFPWARHDAALLAEHGYGVWARPGPDLTEWQEPDHALLLATAGLTAERAERFGFIALAQAW